MDSQKTALPEISLVGLFLRFLRFGFLAWGGPVAQIGMIKQELVDREKWISPDYFNRVLAVYQMLPGPEAAELCVFLGYLRRGRLGGILSGLGFMLPGFILMFILSWFYVTYGLQGALFGALFYGLKPAVTSLVILSVLRISRTALTDPWLIFISVGAFLASTLGQASFVSVILFSGLFYFLVKFPRQAVAENSSNLSLLIPFALLGIAYLPAFSATLPFLWSGLKAGLLTFGGAYTAIPLLQEDAVANNHWLTNAQFLDGLALGGILPAPLIIFSTFVGYIGGGPWGALAMTLGVWLPAFSFTLLGHQHLERLVHHPRWQVFLRGVMAGVVGLIAATALELSRAAIIDIPTVLLAGLALVILWRWPSAPGVLAGVLVPGTIGVSIKLFGG